MAEKDWKLSKPESRIAFRYDNKNIDSYVHGVSTNEYPKISGDWIVVVVKNNEQIIYRKLKSKSSALAYARDYMRRH